MNAPVSDSELDAWCAKLDAAQRELAAAKDLLSADKQRRKASLSARLGDWLTTTPSERAVAEAEERLSEITREAQAAAQNWVSRTANTMMKAAADQGARHHEQTQRECRAKARLEKVRRWLDLARTALDRLRNARSACESASSSEVLDAITTNKAFSALSYLSTTDAAEAIKAAERAVQTLVQALPKRVETGAIELPEDLLDLAVDLVFELDFDIVSWLNIGRLDEAAQACEESARKLRPLVAQLEELAADAQVRCDQESSAVRAIEAPYLERASALVPNALRRVHSPSAKDEK